MSKPFPELPDSTGTKTAGEKLYEQRTDKGTFVNPPGYEHSFAVHSWGRSNMHMTEFPRQGGRDRGATRDAAELAMMRKRRGMEGESLSVKRRPLK